MQLYTVYLNLSTAQHISDGISTHHQQLISLYVQYLALLRPLLLPVVNVTGWELLIQGPPKKCIHTLTKENSMLYVSTNFNYTSHIILYIDCTSVLASCQQTCMTYTIAVCTVKNS